MDITTNPGAARIALSASVPVGFARRQVAGIVAGGLRRAGRLS
ncbi:MULTISPECIES: hypothetical protein [Microbacterium]|nr:hypothetical protein [Microbacterium barkeri]MDI6941968.1 hypothetical protein [Microbacterium barkeri]